MAHDYLQIFSNLHVIDCKMNGVLCNIFATPTGIGKEGKSLHADCITDFERFHYIGRVAATGKHNQHIVWPSFDFDLLRVYLVVTKIVGQTSQHCRIRAQRLNAQPAPAISNSCPVQKIISQMDSVAGTTAVAAEIDSAAFLPCLAQGYTERFELTHGIRI